MIMDWDLKQNSWYSFLNNVRILLDTMINQNPIVFFDIQRGKQKLGRVKI